MQYLILNFVFCRIVDFDAKDNDDNTPLSYAAVNGHLEVVKELLQKEADMKAQDILGDTPVHKAAEGGHTRFEKSWYSTIQ